MKFVRPNREDEKDTSSADTFLSLTIDTHLVASIEEKSNED